MYTTTAWGKLTKEGGISKFEIQRNKPGDLDVQFDVKYCGICHTDVHFAEKTATITKFPFVPGHELAGVVTKVGSKVTDVKVGDHVGLGWISDSCQECSTCNENEEQVCEKGVTNTYNTDTVHGHIKTGTGFSHGGYSHSMTANRRYILKIPKEFPLEKAGPLFCAGITMYSPLRHWGCLNGGKRVGIVGIGGLGQMGIRLAKAMGNSVTAISTSPHKDTIAKEIGADRFILSNNADSMASAGKSLDLILNTVSADHNLSALIGLLARDGTCVQLGVVRKPHAISQMIFFRRVNLSGSLIGGMKDTQDCIDFCHKHGIQPAIEMVTADQIESVYEKLSAKNDQITRYVLDINKSK